MDRSLVPPSTSGRRRNVQPSFLRVMRRLIFGLLLMAMGCGQSQTQSATSPLAVVTTTSPTATIAAPPTPSPSADDSPGAKPSPLPKPSTSTTLVFAALEAKGTPNPEQWNTVVIAGLDGYARAKTTFTPMRVPIVGCTGTAVPPLPAHLAAGKVYFADAAGVVKSLSINGQIARVATFPLTSGQQMLSFAVSPDGSRLLGAVLTAPPNPQFGCNGSRGVGDFTLDVYSAPVGGANTLLRHEVLAHNDPKLTILPVNILAFAGWDRVGPLATYPTDWIRGCCSLPHNYDGTPVRVDASSGAVIKEVSPPTCNVQDVASSGNYLCSVGLDGRSLSVRRPDGSEVWKASGEWTLLVSFLSPDEGHLAAPLANAGADTVEVVGRDGSRKVLAGGFWPVGWLDPTTVIGTHGGVNLSYVALSAPSTLVDMGFKGRFVGIVRN